MAIIIQGFSTCSICRQELEENGNILSWQSFLPSDHQLWQYSDSAMHESCFQKWEHKNEFEELYNYQPLIDFEDLKLKKQIAEFGMPDWLNKIKEYRKNKTLPNKR